MTSREVAAEILKRYSDWLVTGKGIMPDVIGDVAKELEARDKQIETWTRNTLDIAFSLDKAEERIAELESDTVTIMLAKADKNFVVTIKNDTPRKVFIQTAAEESV